LGDKTGRKGSGGIGRKGRRGKGRGRMKRGKGVEGEGESQKKWYYNRSEVRKEKGGHTARWRAGFYSVCTLLEETGRFLDYFQ
jgi:hypothetical protein